MEDLLPVSDEGPHFCTEPNRRSTYAKTGFFDLMSRWPAGVRVWGTGFLARTLLIESANIRRIRFRTDQRTMENLHEMQLTIPVAHMAFFVALLSFCLLFARYKLGLSITFCFTFYWGFIYNKDVFFSSFEGSSPFLFIYFFSGFLLILFALFSFVSED